MPCCDLNADGKAFGHQDIQTDACERPGVVSWFLSQGAYRRATSSLPFRVLLQILRDGRYSVKRELSEEDRAALAIEVKLMERSLVQAGVDLP